MTKITESAIEKFAIKLTPRSVVVVLGSIAILLAIAGYNLLHPTPIRIVCIGD